MYLRARKRGGVESGFTLVEILVTVLILLVGIVGVVGLQAKASMTELESYQRGQALTLVRDMAARITSSRALVASGSGYLDDSLSSTDGSKFFGVAGSGTADLGACTSPTATSSTLAVATSQVCEWTRMVQGAAEAGASGTMLGARGCLLRNTPPDSALADFYIVVVWQGVAAGKEPLGMVSGEEQSPMSMCASSVNFGTGMRRGVSMRVMVPNLN